MHRMVKSRRSSQEPSLRRERARPRLEVLEDRTVPSVAQFVPGDLIVKYRADVAPGDRAAALTRAGAARAEHIQTDAMRRAGDHGLELLHGVPDVAAAASALRGLPGVVYAEPNWVYTTGVVSNDTHYTNGSLWGMYSDDLPNPVGPAGTTNQYGSQAEEAWNANFIGSNTVYVGIIDEGVQITHPDLSANAWTNPFDPADGVDNDGNGRIDDVNGWDFVSNDNTVYDGTGDDHGTHVTGTIGAQGGNDLGVSGINWNVTYIPVKFLGATGGTTANAIAAVDYLTDLKVRHGLNIVATNNSWGGGGFSQGLLDAINRAAAQNILFVAAAGNNGTNNDTSPFYPASYNAANLISVASITSGGARSSFSNYGATSVDLGAPGSVVRSTVPTNAYADYSGTSMATPHVTGAVALYASANAGATAAQIRTAILNSVTPTASLNGLTATGGRLNVSALMGLPSSPTFSIDDIALAEGNSGPTSFTFTVTRSGSTSETATVDFATANGTAAEPSDYTAVTLTSLTFAPGDASKLVTVTVNGDTTSESNETFFVNLSNASGATIADGQGQGTIQNDDAAPTPSLSMNNVSLTEGNSGTKAFAFTVTLSSASAQTITVSYATANGTATSLGSRRDYTSTSGTLTFNPGVTSRTINVSVRGDRRIEASENFFVNLSNPSNATLADGQGEGIIVNDDGGAGPGGGPDGGRVGEAEDTIGGLASWLPEKLAFRLSGRSTPPAVSSGAPASLPVTDGGDWLVAVAGSKAFDAGPAAPRSSASTATDWWAFDADWWAFLSPIDVTVRD